MKGSSVVEFALTLPVFIILVVGIIEFGWCFFVQHLVQYATREGMRLAIVGRTLTNMSPEASIIYTIRQEASLAVNPDWVLISIYPVGRITATHKLGRTPRMRAGRGNTCGCARV